MNSENQNLPAVKPNVEFINDIISYVSTGKFLLPKFQRKFVWEKKDIISFFDSIYKGYPIGSVLLWDGGGKDINFTSTIGGAKIDISHENFSQQKYYIVDGQQRISTLFCCLSDHPGILDKKWSFYFDLTREVFYSELGSERKKGAYFDVRAIKKTTSFIREVNRILEQTGDESLVEKAEILADKIRKYKIAVIYLEGGSLSEIVEIFTRLNFYGKNIKPQDLVYALTYNEDENNRVNNFITEVQECFSNNGYRDFTNDFCLQVIKSAIGLEMYDKDWQKLVSRLKEIEKNEPEMLDEIIKSLNLTLVFFRENLMIFKLKMIPYVTQFFMVFHYIHHIPVHKNDNKKLLANLFYYIALFSLGKGSPSSMEALIQFFKNGANGPLPNLLGEKLNSELHFDVSAKFSAGSASAKIISLIIYDHANKMLGVNVDELEDWVVYPPENISSDKSFSQRLGQKRFLKIKDEDRSDAGFLDSLLFDVLQYNSEKSISISTIEDKEKNIQLLSQNFTKEVINVLEDYYF